VTKEPHWNGNEPKRQSRHKGMLSPVVGYGVESRTGGGGRLRGRSGCVAKNREVVK